ncbi:Mitochondrial outer membrane protein porin 6 [Apostasia shenzhenica]|uniref:Mitochondrial outer membrane protein porin 6 n=1 Tax=Apostasia shenzhenica TaxID=1088818 RepID=A0A2I0AHH6_9ASPA|nr:Mitochondrial outer membrane protein porin 6 [Apostasia shenzhenica]
MQSKTLGYFFLLFAQIFKNFYVSKSVLSHSNIDQSLNADLLTKDYNYEKKFTFTALSAAGLGLTATGVKLDDMFIGDISTKYRSGKTIVDVKVDTHSNVSTTVTIDEVISGAKASFSFKIPDQNSGKLDVQYANNHVAINSSVGMNTTPLLELAAATVIKELSLGGEVAFDSVSATFTKCNAGIGINKQEFSASLILANKGDTLKASYVHFLNPHKSSAVAAEMVHRLKTSDNSFTIGASHALDPLTTIKGRLSNDGKVAVLSQREWRPKSLVTFSAEFDPKAAAAASRVGLALALHS